jgi:hypothetical protein
MFFSLLLKALLLKQYGLVSFGLSLAICKHSGHPFVLAVPPTMSMAAAKQEGRKEGCCHGRGRQGD